MRLPVPGKPVLLLDAGANVHGVNAHGFTALHMAAAGRDMMSMKMLLRPCPRCPLSTDFPADCRNAHCLMMENTPLHTAHLYGWLPGIEALLWFGADPRERNHEGHTPEDSRPHLPVARRILATWADGAKGLRRVLASEAGRRVVPSLAQLCAVTIVRDFAFDWLL